MTGIYIGHLSLGINRPPIYEELDISGAVMDSSKEYKFRNTIGVRLVNVGFLSLENDFQKK